jgi:hypothetical protein
LEFLDKNTEECAGRLFEIIADPDLDDLETLSNAISTVSALAGNELTEKAVKYAIDYCSSAFGVKDYSEYQQLRDICNIQTDLLKNYDIKPKLQELSDRLITTYYKLMNKVIYLYYCRINSRSKCPVLRRTLNHLNVRSFSSSIQ